MRKIFCWIIYNHKWQRTCKDGYREVFTCTECGTSKETYKGKKTKRKF